MPDGSPPDADDSPGSWREYEQVDEQYREPEPEEVDLGPGTPTPPAPPSADIDADTARRFWALVAIFNLAILGLSLGAMFVLFERNYTLGGQLLLGGGAVFLFGLYRYRTARATLEERSERTDQATEPREEQD